MKISAETDTGRVRTDNQDSYAIGDLPNGGVWAVVCDGMGGHAGGSTASKMAAESIARDIAANYRQGMSFYSLKNMLASALSRANTAVFEKASKEQELYGMGTTVVAAICAEGKGIVAHVGDSRCCLISDSSLTKLTRDQSLVQELVDAGAITESEAVCHPQKNIITRALGIDSEVQGDYSEILIEKGEKLLLCTDGLTNHVSEDEIIRCVNTGEIFDCAHRLISLANSSGGTDNITAVVIAG